MSGGSAEFSLVLPNNWLILDVAGEQRIADEVADLLERGRRMDAAFDLHRGRIEKQLRSAIRATRREPVAFAALLVTVLNDVLPLFASLTAAVLPSSGDAFRGRFDAETRRVELPSAGPAVRQQFTDTATDPHTGIVMPAVVDQWLVPMPKVNRRLVLTFVSPDTDPALREAFEDLFAAIVESLSFADTQVGAAS